ncbi:MAG: hypothetical protein JW829_21000, partial [Pirellulales bacterium]|nr:hypothetical protein [Pirellulales bacterium]
LDKVGKVTIEGKPKTVSRDSTHAKLRIQTKVEVDMGKYQTFVRKLRPFMQKVSINKAECTFQGRRLPGLLKSPSDEDLFNRLAGEGRIVALLKDINQSATRIRYDMFRVPVSFDGAILDARQQMYRLNVALLDTNQNILMEAKHDLTTRNSLRKWILPLSHSDVDAISSFRFKLPTAWIVPFLYEPNAALFVVREVDVDVPLETLDQTSHYAVAIEDAGTDEQESSRSRSSGRRRGQR